MLKTNITSSLEKCLPTCAPQEYPTLTAQKIIGGERFSFQLLMQYQQAPEWGYLGVNVALDTDLAFTQRQLVNVPVTLPVYAVAADENYLSLAPGLYPDLLMPSPYGTRYALSPDVLVCVWFDIEADDVPVGTHEIPIKITGDDGTLLAEQTLTLTRLPYTLPSIDFRFTEWFHCDCLADYYGVKVWSDEHFRIVENFARAARRQGMNMILTPIHTPPLDTAIGGERTTNQLVRITRENGEYHFHFEHLDRFIHIMDKLGFEYFELAHLFTQWGAEHAPKIVLTKDDGSEEKIFGWETDATGEEYVAFLGAYIPALIAHLCDLGVMHRCYFHISDEPNKNNYKTYLAAKEIVRDLIAPFPIMDAASNYEFYRDGIVDIAIPANNHIAPFLENEVEGLWTYYCCCQTQGVANNLIAMPAYRTRTLAYQMFKYHIVGFLQWGFNFYNTHLSIAKINPFLENAGGGWVPAGDPFVVYPAPDGTPYESIRLLIFGEVMSELRLCHLVAEKVGYDATVRLMEKFLGTISFDRCATSSAPVLALHNALLNVLG